MSKSDKTLEDKVVDGDVELITKSAPSVEEEQILLDKAVADFQAMDKTDPRFLGIDLETKEYYILGNKFKIKQLGFQAKKRIRAIFDKYDDIARKLSELSDPNQATERIGLLQDLDHVKDEIVEEAIPIMLDDGKGFNVEKWFGDIIPAAVWWDVARDLYLFLRENGSKEDTLRSIMLSSSVSKKA